MTIYLNLVLEYRIDFWILSRIPDVPPILITGGIINSEFELIEKYENKKHEGKSVGRKERLDELVGFYKFKMKINGK